MTFDIYCLNLQCYPWHCTCSQRALSSCSDWNGNYGPASCHTSSRSRPSSGTRGWNRAWSCSQTPSQSRCRMTDICGVSVSPGSLRGLSWSCLVSFFLRFLLVPWPILPTWVYFHRKRIHDAATGCIGDNTSSCTRYNKRLVRWHQLSFCSHSS